MSSQSQKTAPVPAKNKWLLIAAVAALVAVSLFFVFQLFEDSADNGGSGRQKFFSLSPISETIDQQNPTFQRVGLISPLGCEAVLDYYKQNALKEVTPWGLGGWSHFGPVSGVLEADIAQDSTSSQSRTASSQPSHSTTNIQVEGVDEADIVKTDGNYIYALSGQDLNIIDIGQISEDNPPAVVSEVELGFWATDMLLSLKPKDQGNLSDTLVVLGYGEGNQFRLVQIDIDDRQEPKMTADLAIDGSYVGVRLADNRVRLVMTSQPLGFEWETPAGSGLRAEDKALEANKEIIRNSELNNWIPAYKNNLQEDSKPESLMDCSQMLVPNLFSGLNTLSIMTFNASEELSPAGWKAVGLAANGQGIYATADNVYVATTESIDDEADPAESPDEPSSGPVADLKTIIHKFGLEESGSESSAVRPVYLASGEVDGILLNQFSMDEYQGDLRVAVTIDDFDENAQENHVKVLRPKQGVFEEIGTISGLGINERIFAVRFMGPQAYVVTFERIDPLYTLDLSDPTNPQALGELKITGFSSYLHPVGDNLLLGIGQEADLDGRTQGLQISLFDTSDPTAPRRVSQLMLKDVSDLGGFDALESTWSSSPAEHDHRAFLFYEDVSYVPYNFSWSSRFSRTWGSEAGILALSAKDGVLLVENVLEATRQKDNNQTGPETHLEPMRTIVVGDSIYGITGNGELIVWPSSGGKPLHIVDY